LKFALQTDFHEYFKPDEDYYKAYYKRAVLQVENLIRTQCCNFINDRAVDSIAQACFLAYDPDYYFCSEVQPLKLNHSAIRQEVESTLQATKGQLASTSFDRLTSDEIKEEVLYYLEGVPADLQYDKRLPINYTVLYYFGDDGIDILMKHWSHPNREKLKKDLKSQLANVQSPAMNALKAYSAKHTKTKYTDSSFAYAQPSSTTFPDRDPVDVARQKVADAIDDFLANPTDTVIKAPCGIGKSTYMAQRLAALPWNTKVLYLAPTHELAEEVENKVRNEIITLNRKAGLPRYGSQTTRIQGRTRQHKGGLRLCEDDFAYDQWLSKGFSIPTDYCLACMHNPCAYIEQFGPLANIRFATHADLRNNPSNWEGGYKYSPNGLHAVCDLDVYSEEEADFISIPTIPRTGNWKPDLLIIDESFFTSDRYELHPKNQTVSLSNIAHAVLGNTPIPSAVQANAAQLKTDYGRFIAKKLDAAEKGGTWIDDFQKRYTSSDEHFFSIFMDVLKKGKMVKAARSISLDREKDPTRLLSDPLPKIHNRFSSVPKLVFDATANERFFMKAMKSPKFVQVDAKPSPGFKVYQCQNKAFSKTSFAKDQSLVTSLVSDIQSKIDVGEYAKIGLISYKNVGDKSDITFAEQLAEKLVTPLNIATGHFGNIRGLNRFDDCDVLFVVGRYALHPSTVKIYTQQLYPKATIADRMGNLFKPARYQESDAVDLQAYDFSDEHMQIVSDAFGVAETVQAIYRLRPFDGRPKKVYYYSSWGLGSDVSIDAFFDFQHGQIGEILDKFRDIGFVRVKKSDLLDFGFTESQARASGHAAILPRLQSRGIVVFEVTFTRNGRKETQRFWVYDRAKLDAHLQSLSFRNIQSRKVV
jgi:hypothetical protein